MNPAEPLTPRLGFGSIGVESDAARAYLINMGETIQHHLLPNLQGHAQAQALACLRTTLHLAAALQPPVAAFEREDADPAVSEGLAFESAFDAAESLIASISASSPPPGRRCDPLRIQTYLQAQPRGGAELRVTAANLLPGGRSKQTILVTVENACDLPSDLVFRQDWAAAVTGTSVAMEFEVLARLHVAGVRVPHPLLLEAGKDTLDAPFIVVSRLPGKVIGNLFDPPESAQPVRELAEQLGRTHALPVQTFEGLPGIAERSYTTAQLRADLAKFRAVIEQLASPLPQIVRAGFDWLDQTVDRIRGPRRLVHGDLGFHNNLCDGERLSAVLDWEMAHLGNPALDLGYIKVMVERRLPWDELLGNYHRAGGPEIDAFAVDWYGVYTNLWFMHLVLQARAAVVSGALHDMDYAYVCAHYGPAAHAYLSKRLRTAMRHDTRTP